MISNRKKNSILLMLGDKDDFQHMEEADPTPTGKYLFWIASLHNINIRNDKHKIREYLRKFDQYKKFTRFTRNKDIFKYRSFNRLADAVDEYEGINLKSNRQLFKDIKSDGTTIYKHENIKVVMISTPEAAVLYSKGTRWCTSTYEVAANYLADGPLYVIFKDGEKIAQADFYFNEVRDIRDDKIALPNEDIYNIYDATKELKVLTKMPVTRLNEYYEDVIVNSSPMDIVAYLISVDSVWPEAEPIITTDPNASFRYAFYVLGGKWPEGESVILQSPKDAYWYTTYFIDGRWPEAEQSIIDDGTLIVSYAKDIIGGRWPEAESDLVRKCDKKIVEEYISLIEKEWPEAAANLRKQ